MGDLPFEDEITLAGHGLDVLVELDHGDVLGQVPNEDSLHRLVLLRVTLALRRDLAGELEVAALRTEGERAELGLARDGLCRGGLEGLEQEVDRVGKGTERGR